MKNTIKTLMIMAGLLQGGAVMANDLTITINTGGNFKEYKLQGNCRKSELNPHDTTTCTVEKFNDVVLINDCALTVTAQGVQPTSPPTCSDLFPAGLSMIPTGKTVETL